jgi:hypothetical protein
MISISELCIAAVARADELADAVRALQNAFGLGPPEQEAAGDRTPDTLPQFGVQALAATRPGSSA